MSESLTPPLSPSNDSYSIREFSSESRLLNSETTKAAEAADVIKIFCVIRKEITRLEMAALTTPDVMQTRSKIVQHLCSVKVMILSFSELLTADDVLGITGQLKATWLHLGLLCDTCHGIRPVASNPGSNCGDAMFHTWHMHIEVRWHMIDIAHLLHSKCSGLCSEVPRICKTEGPSSQAAVSFFFECSQLELWDLICLATKQFRKNLSPFNCPCVRELWLLLISLCDTDVDFFWMRFHRIVETLISDRDSQPETGPDGGLELDIVHMRAIDIASSGDVIHLGIWLLHQSGSLYRHLPQSGTTIQVRSNHHTLETLLRAALSAKLTEKSFRAVVIELIEAEKLWEPNTQAVMLLWEHFSKRLNDSFSIGLDEMATIYTSIPDWLKVVKQRIHASSSVSQNSGSSFQMFLTLMAFQLQRAGKETWVKLKSRIYSKFHHRMMMELTEAGWCNLLNLFLTLALVTDTEDVTSRIVDLLDMVGPLTEKSVSSLVIRGCFVLCLINEEKETDASSLAHRLSLYFTAACREISVASSDSRRHQWYNQIAVYLEGIEELRIVHPTLIGEGFKMVFSCCRDQELRKVLLVLTQAIDSFCHRIMQTPITSADEVSASAWWKNVFPFVKSHVMTLTPSSQLTDLAVSFTRLARHLPPEGSTGVHETYLTCLEYFGFDESVSASVSTSFLWQMSNNQELEQLSDVEARIIQTLFRCCLQTPLQNASMSSTEHLQQLAQLVLALPKFRQEFSSAGMQLPTGPEHPHAVIMAFIKALSASYAQSASLLEKRNLQLKAESYLGNVAAHAGKVLKSANPDELKTAYSLVGRLIKNCSLLLYSKTRPDCILVEVIETMLFPRSLTSSKQGLHPAVQHAIREHLILFVHGLKQLDQRDPYVSRRLADIKYHWKFQL